MQIKVLDKGFITLIDTMGDDNRIVQAARTSYGMDDPRGVFISEKVRKEQKTHPELQAIKVDKGYYLCYFPCGSSRFHVGSPGAEDCQRILDAQLAYDRRLIRRLMMDSHTSPFEMVEFTFCVQVPMDCWRQWVRHRTANINEYSTRYAEALDFFQVADNWRLQASDNKQGSSGYLEEWPNDVEDTLQKMTMLSYRDTFPEDTPSQYLSHTEKVYHKTALALYQERLALGIAKEQARKDLPLSTYTRAYWKCDLHNIFNFLRLRMDSHAQLEIRSYANAMFEIVKSVCPFATEAFVDYVLESCRFSRMEMECIRQLILPLQNGSVAVYDDQQICKPDSMTDYEWTSFLKKLS
jgi:flavin-dependent thymidylate synthase